jgi:RNA polymerase sigma-70 factor, ECF subfamily
MLREPEAKLRSLADDGTTFEEFYRAEYPRLVRALLLLAGSPGVAEDLAQDAFTRLYERWGHVRTMDSTAGYLYKTALNLHRSRLRRLLLQARRGWPQSSRRDPIDVADDRLEVLRAVSTLPDPQRESPRPDRLARPR